MKLSRKVRKEARKPGEEEGSARNFQNTGTPLFQPSPLFRLLFTKMVSIVLFEGPLLLLCCSFASGSYRMVSILLFEDPLLLLCRSFASGSYRMVAKKQSQLSSPPSASCRVQSGYVGSVACRVPDAEGLKDVTYLKGFYQPVCLIFEFFSRKIRLVLKCPSCAREDTHFQSAKLFLRHQLLYHLDLKYRCPQCGARLKRYVSAEGRGLSLPESQSGEVLFICLGPTETQQRSTKAKKNVMNAMLPS